jgi:hypothetical protein
MLDSATTNASCGGKHPNSMIRHLEKYACPSFASENNFAICNHCGLFCLLLDDHRSIF